MAAYVAITLGYVALYNFGLTGEDVRGAAMIIAVLIAAMVAIDFSVRSCARPSEPRLLSPESNQCGLTGFEETILPHRRNYFTGRRSVRETKADYQRFLIVRKIRVRQND